MGFINQVITANQIKTGTLDASRVSVVNLNASNITAGTLDAAKVSVVNLNASNIKTGNLSGIEVDLSDGTGANTAKLTGGKLQTYTANYAGSGWNITQTTDGSGMNFSATSGGTTDYANINFVAGSSGGIMAGASATTGIQTYNDKVWTKNATLDDGGGNLTTNSVYTSNWFRSTGNSGWYSQTYGGGIFMQDSTWVRTYNGKPFWSDGGIAGRGRWCVESLNGQQIIEVGSFTVSTASGSNYTQRFQTLGAGFPTAMDGVWLQWAPGNLSTYVVNIVAAPYAANEFTYYVATSDATSTTFTIYYLCWGH